MALLVRAFPLRRPVAELEAFAAELRARQEETDGFYRGLGVSHESWHLQETPAGAWVITLAKLEDPADAGARHAEAAGDFERWFKRQVEHLSGIDPNVQPLGPATTRVFEWSDEGREGSNLCA